VNVGIRSILLTTSMLALLTWALVASYYWLDRSITLAYTVSSHDSAVAHMNALRVLLLTEWHGLSREEVLSKLHQDAAAVENLGELKDEGDIIWAGRIRLLFRDNTLADIE
jgi:hypothetical protein